jgi:hypothetical protein
MLKSQMGMGKKVINPSDVSFKQKVAVAHIETESTHGKIQ